jgi:hypothetical protein
VHNQPVKADKPPYTAVKVAADKITVFVAVPTVSAFDNWEVIQVKEELGNAYTQNSVCIEKLDCHEYIRS